MKTSELISALQERLDIYGDWNVIIRLSDDDADIDLMSVYVDDEVERIIVSDFPDIE